MKNRIYLLAIIALSCFSLPAWAQNADEAAVKEIVRKDIEFWLAGNYDAWTSLYANTPYIQATGAGATGVVQRKGWDALSAFMKPVLAKNAASIKDITFTQENMSIQISGNLAWVYCDQNQNHNGSEAWQHYVLEKIDGQWKIVSLISISHSSYNKK